MIRLLFTSILLFFTGVIHAECDKNTSTQVFVEHPADYGRNDKPLAFDFATEVTKRLLIGYKSSVPVSSIQLFSDSKKFSTSGCPPTLYLGNLSSAVRLFGNEFIVLGQEIDDTEMVVATPKASSFFGLEHVQKGKFLLVVPDSAEEAYVAGAFAETEQVHVNKGAKLISVKSSHQALQALTPSAKLEKGVEYGNILLLGKQGMHDPESMGVIARRTLVEAYNAQLAAQGRSFAQFRIMTHPKFIGPGMIIFARKGGESFMYSVVTKNVMTATQGALFSTNGYTARKDSFDKQYARYLHVEKNIVDARIK
jgi:hypothetical protein